MRMAIIKKSTNYKQGEDVKKRESLYAVGGEIGTAIVENHIESFFKTL